MIAVLVLLLLAAVTPVDIRPVVATQPVPNDADDPAIWVHPTDPLRSLIFGTNKVVAPAGALVVFGLDGKIRQTIAGIDRPNNVDVEYGLRIGGAPADIAVLTERMKSRLRVFRIASDGSGVADAGAIPVFEGQSGEAAMPMGIALYKRPRDGAVFAVVSRKTGPSGSYLWQYRLEDAGSGKVRGVKVREFGAFAGDEIEAVAVDDALGYIYYADEGSGIRKYHADPDRPDAAKELAHFATTGFLQQEGIAIYGHSDGTGYIVATNQLPGNSEYYLYRRQGAPGRPHDHSEVVRIVRGGADSTDGIEVTPRALGPKFPRGLLVVMNSKLKNFLIYRWEDAGPPGK